MREKLLSQHETVIACQKPQACELLEGGADPNCFSDGVTPMHLAAGLGLEQLGLLLQFGGDPNVSLDDGTTPLHVAAIWGLTDSVRLLLANGVDTSLRDQDGFTASQLARQYGHMAACSLIEAQSDDFYTADDQTLAPKYAYRRLSVESDVSQKSCEVSPLSTRQHPPPSTRQSWEVSSLPPDESPQSGASHLHGFLEEFTSGRRSSFYTRLIQRDMDRHFRNGTSNYVVDVTSPDHPYVELKTSVEAGTEDSLNLQLSTSDCGEQSTESFVTCDGEDLETVLKEQTSPSPSGHDDSYDDYTSHSITTVVKNPRYAGKDTGEELHSNRRNLLSRKYCRRELIVPAEPMQENSGSGCSQPCEYCGAEAVKQGNNSTLCVKCHRLAQELDHLMASGEPNTIPDLLMGVREPPTGSTSAQPRTNISTDRLPEIVNQRDKTFTVKSHSSDITSTTNKDTCFNQNQNRSHGHTIVISNDRVKSGSEHVRSSRILTSNPKSVYSKIEEEKEPKPVNLKSKDEKKHKTAHERLRKEVDYIREDQSKSILLSSNRLCMQLPNNNPIMQELVNRMNRTSLDLRDGPGMFSDSTFTHVTRLDHLNDSLLTNDESFMERHPPFVKKHFHESDISMLSADTTVDAIDNATIADVNKLYRNIVKNKFHQGDISTVSTDTFKSHDPVSERNMGFIDTNSSYRKSSSSAQNSLQKRANSSSDSQKQTNACNNINDLWSEVRACKHEKQVFKDKKNVLDTAFCGRESACPSAYSDESTVDYVYTDKENGITLIERHLPSLCGSVASRRSIDSVLSQRTVGSDDPAQQSVRPSLDSQCTEPYDWRDRGMLETSGDSGCGTVSAPTSQPCSQKLLALDNDAIRSKLCTYGADPGPVTKTTRQAYLKRLSLLESNPDQKLTVTRTPEYPRELRQALSGNLDLSEMSDLEMQMFEAFQNPDPQRRWREGTLKSSFNYLLLDPRITKNLPNRVCNMCELDVFQTFIGATFYIGKGMRARPYSHLYEAIKHQNNPAKKASGKVQRILDIWLGGEGVVSLHCFQSVIPVEAYTREACMVDAIGLEHLTNQKRGDYYGVSVTYSAPRKRTMGVYLLKKALQIFLAEGERQISPADIKKP
ncbi:hypothetical protein DPMN_111047 [Dreissena polymorpha]|uniref:LEM domain-containing protein n=1 Tax=Dreissena polymorpha TaxID=45954 RepID=A0A9D4QPE5_DREPO|nr:hypothetical protein DPMN_111047 [Dreissena polymorpha]